MEKRILAIPIKKTLMTVVRAVSVGWWADSEASVDSGVNWRLERGGHGCGSSYEKFE